MVYKWRHGELVWPGSKQRNEVFQEEMGGGGEGLCVGGSVRANEIWCHS